MRALLVVLVVFLSTDAAAAVDVVSVFREVSYSGGLQQPGTIGDSRSSSALGGFSEDLSDVATSAEGETAAAVAQISSVDKGSSTFAIIADGDVSARAITTADGVVADAFSESTLEVVFTTHETTTLTVDIVVSASLGNFFDGSGAGAVEAFYSASFLLCQVGGGCVANLFVEDITDNLQAVSDGFQVSGLLPAGSYEVELAAISQGISRDDGSTLGSAGFSGSITVVPEPDGALSGLAGLAGLGLIALLHRHRQRRAAPACTG